MTDRIDIRPALPEDIGALLPMVQQYWRFEAIEGFDATRVSRLLQRVLSDPNLGRGWIGRIAGEPVGYLLAVFVFSLEQQGLCCEIDELFVLPQYRGQGLGGRLLAAAEAFCRIHGCTSIALQIGRDNDAARAFYRGRGYQDRAGFELVAKTLQDS